MIIKQKDSLEQAIQQLETIIRYPGLSHNILDRVRVELRTLKAGMTGETNAAYFINFDFAERKSWAIIHDLRIEHGGLVAQIDHLLISRFLEFYVLESKSYSSGIKITDRGEFLTEYNGKYIAIESPIEQNRRHTIVLENLLRKSSLLPTRLGVTLQPTMLAYVLVSPKSMVRRPSSRRFNTDMVIKADELLRKIESEDDKAKTLEVAGLLVKMVSSETLMQMAHKLVALHKPADINYYEKYGLDANALAKASIIQTPSAQRDSNGQTSASKYFCFNCRKSIRKKVADFCFQNKKRFGGKAYCFDCQKSF